MLSILNVEDEGLYSTLRTKAFELFLKNTNSLYGLTFLVPLPALLIMAVLYNIPLTSPTDTVNENGMFFVLSFLAKSVEGLAIVYIGFTIRYSKRYHD